MRFTHDLNLNHKQIASSVKKNMGMLLVGF